MKNLIHLTVSFLMIVAGHLSPGARAYAAPGDFIRAWGAQQHFNYPAGIAVDASGKVLVTDRDRVQVFDSAGVRVLKWGASGSADGQFSLPRGIAAGAGKVYVADTGNKRVQILDGEGAFIGKLEHPDWATKAPIAVAVDTAGQLYVAEADSGTVKVFDNAGSYLRQLGSVGSGAGQYGIVGGVAVDAGGNVYVVDTGADKVQMYGPTGDFIKTAVTAGNLSGAIAVDGTGRIYLAYGSNVFIYDSAGVLVATRHYDDGPDSDDGNRWWEPTALAVDGSGNVYTVDLYNDGVRAFDNEGALLPQWWSYGTGTGQLNHPRGIAVDAGGNLYETDGVCAEAGVRNNRVQVFTTEGVSQGKWTGTFCQTSGLSTDSSGKVYVVETYNQDGNVACDPTSIVKVFESSGNFLREWGEPFNADINHRLNDFLGVVIDKKGNFIVVHDQENNLRVYDSAGTLFRTIGGPYYTPGGLGDPTAAAVDKDGNIYVIDTFPDTVRVFDSDYNFLRSWGHSGSDEGNFHAAKGVAVDPEGHVFVADTGNNRIQVFDSNGVFIRSWGGTGDDPGLFNAPEGIALDPKGNVVYVADSGNNRIQAFEGYMPPTYTISGTVREESPTGPLLAGATVSIGGKSATTSAFGTYNVTDLPAGTYTLVISKAGHLTRTVSDYVISGNKGSQDYFLTAVYTVSGTVRHGKADGPALGGVTVSIAGKTATTSVAGTFSITGIEGGSYTLTLSKSGYVAKTISLSVNGDSTGIVHFLVPLYSISGTVHHGSASGAALAGATVAIAGKTATTGENGTFSIPEVTAGSHNVVISKTGYVTRSIPGYLVDANKHETGLYLVPLYSLSGSVHQGSVSGPVLPGAVVSIAGKTATTGSNGTFSIPGIPAGTYTLAIYMSGEIARTQYVTKTVRSYVVSSNKKDVFYLAPAYQFSGTVRQGSTSGAVLSGATVAIAGKKVTTGSTGTFNVTGIPAGTYTVTVSKTGFDTRTIAGYVLTGTKRGLNFYLLPLCSLSGTVRQGSATGRALAGATVTIAGRSVVSGSTGAFSISGIPAGTYTITVSKSGFGTRTVSGFVLSGDKSGLNVFLSALYFLSGTVRQGSAAGPALPGAVVTIAGKRATTTSTGAFSISGIPAGTYTLTITRTGFVTKQIPGTVVNSNKSGMVFYLKR